MSSIPKFDSEIYSEEIFSVTESEYDEVMADDWQGYQDWSADLEQAAFEREQERRSIVNTPHGQLLIRKECTHPACKTTRCARDVRIGGIAI